MNPTIVKAVALMQQGKSADAIRLLDNYINANPSDYIALVARGAVFMTEHKPNDAVRDFNAALVLHPGMERVEILNCSALYQLRQLDDAIQACSKAIALDSQDIDGYNGRALALDAKDDATHETAALNDVDRAIALSPNAWSYAERCELKLELKQYDTAVPDCDRALAMDPSNAWTWYQRGKLALHASDYARAEHDFTKAIEDHTSVAYVQVSLAEAQMGLEKYQDALKNVNAYLTAHPDVGAAYLVRARVDARMGNVSQAASDAAVALKDAQAAKDAGDIAEAQAFLDQLKPLR